MPGKAPQQERSMCTTQALEQHSLNWHAVWSWPEWSSTNFAPSVFGSYNNLDFGRCVVPAWMHLEREQFTLYSAGLDGPDRRVVVARFAALGTALWLFLLHRIPLGDLLHRHIPDRPERRLLRASSVLLTFATLRGLTWSIDHHAGPFHDIHIGGRHIHHLVWGILLLGLRPVHRGRFGLCLFFVAVDEPAHGAPVRSRAAMTLDEFALWLNLRDVYWAREGRTSRSAVVLFGTMLLIGNWGVLCLCGRADTRVPQEVSVWTG